MANKQNTNERGNHIHLRGFASMPHERVQEIASKGGHASAEKAGHEGMAERGRKGGHATAEKVGSEGMAERGRAGGLASASGRSHGERSGHGNTSQRGFASMPHEKVQEIASKGGHASGNSKHSHEEKEK